MNRPSQDERPDRWLLWAGDFVLFHQVLRHRFAQPQHDSYIAKIGPNDNGRQENNSSTNLYLIDSTVNKSLVWQIGMEKNGSSSMVAILDLRAFMHANRKSGHKKWFKMWSQLNAIFDRS